MSQVVLFGETYRCELGFSSNQPQTKKGVINFLYLNDTNFERDFFVEVRYNGCRC